MAAAKKKSYDAKDITWLKGAKGWRAKPSVYLGRSADSEGVRQCCLEVVGNCLDEITNGHGDTVGIKIDGDTVTVFDNGRGIPTGPHPEHKGVDTLTILATEMHAGGKLNEDDGNYEVSLGSHGMGLAVVNALSKSMHIWSIRGAKIMKQSFAEGAPTTKVSPAKDLPKLNGKMWKPKTGTIVQFTWDKTVFEKGTKLDAANIVAVLKDMSWFAAHIHKGKRTAAKFIIENGKKTQTVERKHLFNYVTTNVKILSETRKEPIELLENAKIDVFGPGFDFVGSWSSTVDDHFHSAVNSLHTSNGGTHLKGARKAIYDAFRKIANKKQEFRDQDLFSSFIGCFNLRIPSPKFDGQGKNSLTSPNGFDLAYGYLLPVMTAWIKKNKATALYIVERACAINEVTNDTKMLKQLAAALAPKKGGKSLLPSTLVQSTTRVPMEREIFLVEGKSAGGTCKKASTRRFQEILPLRGKMLNVARATSEKMGSSQVIVDILKSIGYNPKAKEDPLRVGRIMVLADPDPDGPLDPNTMIPYYDDTGTLTIGTIEYLARLQKGVDKPIKIVAVTVDGKQQQANATDIGVRETTATRYALTLSNGKVEYCTASHKWRVLNVTNTKKIVTSNVNGLQYLAAPDLLPGDQIQALNQDGYMTVVSCVAETVTYQDYYCMTVPLFGNFCVSTTGSLDPKDWVVSSNCHINALILTLLFKTIPYMFEQGRIYLVKAPLYTYSTPKKKYYGSSLKDLIEQLGGKSKFDPKNVTRVKGFGEMNPEDLRVVAFEEDSRDIVRISHPGAFAKVVDKVMGDNADHRKELLGV